MKVTAGKSAKSAPEFEELAVTTENSEHSTFGMSKCTNAVPNTSDEEDSPISEDYDEKAALQSYTYEWAKSLSWDDLFSLCILLWHLFVGILSLKLLNLVGEFWARVII